jgi:hypothetical protein
MLDKRVGIYNISHVDGRVGQGLSYIIDEIKRYNFNKIFFFNITEASFRALDNEENFKIFKNLLIDRNIKLYIICGAEYQHHIHKSESIFGNKRIVDYINILPWGTSLLHYTMYHLKSQISNFENIIDRNNFNYLYLCYNNKSRYHRCELIDNLSKHELLNDGLVSWRMIKYDDYQINYEFKYWNETLLNIDLEDDGKQILNEWTKQILIPNTFLTIVTESSDDFLFVTEKTFKAILLEQPFICLGYMNQNYILEEYGFELYHEIIDYTFDKKPNLKERTDGVVNNLLNLKNKNLNDLNNIIKDKIKRNKKRALEIIEKDPFLPKELIELFKEYTYEVHDAINQDVIPSYFLNTIKNMIKKNTINLVYDDWLDIDNTNYNGKKHFPNLHFGDMHHLIWSYLDRGLFFEYLQNIIPNNEKFELKKCRFNEVYERPQENFYYFITLHGFNYEKIFKDINFQHFFNQNLKNILLKCKNFYVGFVTEHESDNENGFLELNNFIIKNNLNPKQFYFINNNSLIGDIKKEHNSDVNVYKINFLPFSSTRVLEKAGECSLITEKKGKFFMCFNKGPKRHRYALLCLLKKNSLLEDTNWSLIPDYNPNAKNEFYSHIFDKQEIDSIKEEIEYFSNIKAKKNDYELDVNWIDNEGNFVKNILPEWMLVPTLCVNHENSYINITTESQYLDENKVIHITEKSFKPFYYFQFPLILATHNHIKKMKELYDYDFFDDIINHEYDNEPNFKKRLYMFVEEIKRLNQNKEQIKEFYRNNQQRFIDNKNKVLNMLSDTSDFTFFKNLI